MPLTKLSRGLVAPDIGLTNFRNKIINGDLGLWQRGDSFSLASSEFTADRFMAASGSGGDGTVSKEIFAEGQTEVPGFPNYYLRHSQSVAATSVPWLYYKMEDILTLANEPVVLSFWIKASKVLDIDAYLYQHDGTTANQVQIATDLSIGTSWQRVEIPGFMPNPVSAGLIGRSVVGHTGFWIGWPINDTYTIDVAQFQLESGEVATPFEFRHPYIEQIMCERFYEQLGTGAHGASLTSTQISFGARYRVAKRTTPTLSLVTTTPAFKEHIGVLRTGSGCTIDQVHIVNSRGLYVSIDGFTGAVSARSGTWRTRHIIASSAEL